jgi:K+-sensing histidine kinase KdpD
MPRFQDPIPGDPQRAWQRRPNSVFIKPVAPRSRIHGDAMNGHKMIVAVLCVALSAALRWGLSLVWPNMTDFVTFYPAVVVVTVACGVEAGALAIVLAAVICWWIIIPPPFAFFPLKQDDAVSIALFILSCTIIVATIQPYLRPEKDGRLFTPTSEE